MIEYKSKYEAGQEPHICKLITASNGEEFCTEINLTNKGELDNISDETINEHIAHQIEYAKHLMSGFELYPDPEVWTKPWPFKNLKEMYETLERIMEWWKHLNYNDHEGRPIYMSEVEHELLHEHDEPHEHDEEGNPVYGLGVRSDSTSHNESGSHNV
jgi:hypothetical protein